MKTMKWKYISYLGLILLAILAPIVLRSDYLREVLVITCVYAIAAQSLNIVMGYMGQFSFGHGAFFGLGIYGAALVVLNLGLSHWIGFLVGIILAATGGFLVGYVSLRKVRGMYLAMVTFGFGGVSYLVVCNWWSLTHGMGGLYNIPFPVIAIPGLLNIKLESAFSYYYFVLVLLALVIYFISRLLRTRFGRALISIRENEELAHSVGINVFKVYVTAFTLSAALAGLAGATFVYYVRVASPMQMGMGFMFMLVVIVIVGGTGTLLGPLVGTIIYIWGSELLRISAGLRFFFLGLVLILFIIFLPRGIYPALLSLGEHFNNLFSKNRDLSKTRIRKNRELKCISPKTYKNN